MRAPSDAPSAAPPRRAMGLLLLGVLLTQPAAAQVSAGLPLRLGEPGETELMGVKLRWRFELQGARAQFVLLIENSTDQMALVRFPPTGESSCWTESGGPTWEARHLEYWATGGLSPVFALGLDAGDWSLVVLPLPESPPPLPGARLLPACSWSLEIRARVGGNTQSVRLGAGAPVEDAQLEMRTLVLTARGHAEIAGLELRWKRVQQTLFHPDLALSLHNRTLDDVQVAIAMRGISCQEVPLTLDRESSELLTESMRGPGRVATMRIRPGAWDALLVPLNLRAKRSGLRSVLGRLVGGAGTSKECEALFELSIASPEGPRRALLRAPIRRTDATRRGNR